MIPTTEKYKQFVYSREYARRFIPRMSLDIVAVGAKPVYSMPDQAFYSDIAQLTDGITTGSFTYGTLEDFNFILDGTKRIMPNGALPAGQYGGCSETMSDEHGNCNIVIIAVYATTISTAGRMYVFDDNYDDVPNTFRVDYYKVGTLVATETVTDNTAFTVYATVGVQNYDRIVYTILKTNKPYRRVHLIEATDGIVIEYADNDIVSITLNQLTDVLNEGITAAEIDIVVKNENKQLNIFNKTGFERFLQEGQPINVKLAMSYPDDTEEAITVGAFRTTTWRVDKGVPVATFSARDAMDILMRKEYIKGAFSENAVSFKDLAEEVLQDAGIATYTISEQLTNMYTTAPLPIALHSDILRMIAQATNSAITVNSAGGIDITYVSVLVSALNLFVDPSFDDGLVSWNAVNCTVDVATVHSGLESIAMALNSQLTQTLTTIVGNKYFIRFFINPAEQLETGSLGLYANDVRISADLLQAGLAPLQWTNVSTVYTASTESTIIGIKNTAAAINVDSFQCIDLTTTFGPGNEPTVEWCTANIMFFNNVLLIPDVNVPVYTDDVTGSSALYEYPEIATREGTGAIETNIYAYTIADTATEIYSATRRIAGTQEFIAKFTNTATECVVTVSEGATLVSSSLYANAAVLKITGSGDVSISITGKIVSSDSSIYLIDHTQYPGFVADAKTVTIDNQLVTSTVVAEDMTSFAAYWHSGGYDYDFDWRQNPAVETADWIKVEDEFGVNNTIMVTERNLSFDGGVLSGNTKGVSR